MDAVKKTSNMQSGKNKKKLISEEKLSEAVSNKKLLTDRNSQASLSQKKSKILNISKQ